jgi:hypothetical protein
MALDTAHLREEIQNKKSIPKSPVIRNKATIFTRVRSTPPISCDTRGRSWLSCPIR